MVTISDVLCDPMPKNGLNTVKVTLNITISRNGNYVFSRYSNQTGDFITINPKPRVLIQYSEKDRSWDKHNQIVVTQRNIFQLRTGFKQFYKAFQREDLYTYNGKGYVETVHCLRENLVVIQLGYGQLLRLLPDIAVDRTNIRYPGIQMTINREENKVILSVEEFECLLDLFMNMDISSMGLSLLNIYASMQKGKIDANIDKVTQKKDIPIRTGNKSIFDKSQGEEQCSGPPLVNQPKTLDDI